MHLSTHHWMRPEPLEVSLKRASSLGYKSIELSGEPNIFDNIADVQRLLNKYKISCWGGVTIMSGSRDLTAADPKQRQATVQYIKDIIRTTAELGGQILTIVPATVGKIKPSGTPEEEWNWVVEALKEVCHYATEKGIKVGLEPLNRFETYFLNRADQALRLADEVGYGCGIAFDPFHLAIEEPDMYAAIYRCKGRITDFHVSDNNRLAAGDGSFDWPRIISILKEVGYDGGLAVEPMPPIDRTPASPYPHGQLEMNPIDVDPNHLQFLKDHASGVFSDVYYTSVMKKSAETILTLI